MHAISAFTLHRWRLGLGAHGFSLGGGKSDLDTYEKVVNVQNAACAISWGKNYQISSSSERQERCEPKPKWPGVKAEQNCQT